MEIRSTLRRLTWPEKRLKEKEKGGRGGMKEENETNKRERKRETRIHRLPNVSLPRSEPRKTGRLRSICIFFFLSFSFSQRCVAQTNGHHGSIPTREPLVFPRWRSRKTFQRPRENANNPILRTCTSTDYAHNFSRKSWKFLNFPSRTNWRMV